MAIVVVAGGDGDGDGVKVDVATAGLAAAHFICVSLTNSFAGLFCRTLMKL